MAVEVVATLDSLTPSATPIASIIISCLNLSVSYRPLHNTSWSFIELAIYKVSSICALSHRPTLPFYHSGLHRYNGRQVRYSD